MVQISSTLVFATTLLSTLVSGVPLVDTLARRNYNEVNTNYHQQQPKTVTVTVTKYANGYPPQYSSQTPDYTSEQPTYSDAPAANDWRNQMLDKLNEYRAAVGKDPLRLDTRMNNMAQSHSQYQNSIQKMTHSDSAGSLGQRCSDFGVDWRGVAENVAWNYPDVEAVMEGWRKSDGHYHNMIGDYNVVGFGETNKYWTQDFASV
ncbi:hypothetical protein H4R99_000686 [Coemansia sp. RSA 1722]|nr:hypothetical protein LPJ57_000165 [Coemansia sp. RSA 486]KAJ2237785.1 hypothetical protein IWW45_000673 [Coemansia sp. RSA 485]KAJ2602460.1 hypothetical protein GGF39_000668 [Coemansia sp. RSA 1721]KAJ2605984.1 hypothetical protein H4R99_000686 [Coemansia sp. RSA 1722]KAJ2639628.1 hypothetical protein GGF40_000743 [Coemansia sp. RSA 1286]